MLRSGAGGPTQIGKRIIKLLIERLDGSARMALHLRETPLFDLSPSGTGTNPGDELGDKGTVASATDTKCSEYWYGPHSIVEGIKALGPRSKAYVSSHIDVCDDHSFSLWLRFTDDSIVNMEKEITREIAAGSKVMRGDSGNWAENPDGGIGSTGMCSLPLLP